MTTVLALRNRAYARANWGRWIADCPSPFCLSALAISPRGPLADVFVCLDCGAEAEVIWPTNVREIERFLRIRPDPKTRNWEPGETLHDLLSENIAHGLYDGLTTIQAASPVPLLLTIGDRIILDNTPQIGA